MRTSIRPFRRVPAPSRRAGVSVIALAAITLAGCESDSSGPTIDSTPGEVVIDASSTTTFTYFSLDQGRTVSVTDPQTDQSWDLAFRRFEIRTNSGVAGTKGVLGYNLAAAAPPTVEQVLTRTADNQLQPFLAVTAAQIPADAQFQPDDLGPDFTSWFRAVSTSLIVANPQAVWKVRLAGGRGYAVVRVDSILVTGVASQPSLGYLRLSYRLQTGGALGPEQKVGGAVPAGGEVYFNLTTGQATTTLPAGCDWDFKATSRVELQVNNVTGCNGGTFPVDVTQQFAALTRADDAPKYASYLSRVSGPIPVSFDDPKGPFLYNIKPNPNGPPLFSPTFNIYLVKVGDRVYKLQVLDYYNPADGRSGFPKLRYARIR